MVLPALLHWGIDQHSPEFLPFLVMLHLGTATALLGYFWRDWWAIITGVLGIGGAHQVAESRRVFVLVVIATIPAVVIGFRAGEVRPRAVRIAGGGGLVPDRERISAVVR